MNSAIKERLRSQIDAAKASGQPLPHMLLHGSPDMVKSTFAWAIAREMGLALIQLVGKDLTDHMQLSVLTKVPPQGAVVSIEGIQDVRKEILELLYSVMDFGTICDPTDPILELKLFPVTVIASTTKLQAMPASLADKFPTKIFIPAEPPQRKIIPAALPTSAPGVCAKCGAELYEDDEDPEERGQYCPDCADRADEGWEPAPPED